MTAAFCPACADGRCTYHTKPARSAVQVAQDRARAIEDNRAAMVGMAANIDEFRQLFGPQCRVLWAREGERKLGRELPSYQLIGPELDCWRDQKRR